MIILSPNEWPVLFVLEKSGRITNITGTMPNDCRKVADDIFWSYKSTQAYKMQDASNTAPRQLKFSRIMRPDNHFP
jgi:hypothetical protein